jgi:Uma2 family endonuclease
MVAQNSLVTAEEFDRFVMQPENLSQYFQLVGGKIVEKQVSDFRASIVGLWMMSQIALFVEAHDLGWLTGADGGYAVFGEYYVPDGAFLSKVRCPQIPTETYIPLAPDLALEVLSPTNSDELIRVKLSNYLAAGTLVWVVDPGKRVESHRAGRLAKVLFAGDTLDGEDVLSGFSLPVRDVLAK